jgi:predicted GNAT family acetyltransferase
MPHTFEREKIMAFTIPLSAEAHFGSLSIEPLADENEPEVLAFLSAYSSVQAVFMTSLVRDNGLESPFNRGIFYGARRGAGRELVGIALIGHATLVETYDTASLEAFARVARACTRAHVHLGEEERIKRFWRHYTAGAGPCRPRLICREMLFELREPVSMMEDVEGLRLATLDDLPFVMPVQACMAFEESGVDPMKQDAVGFRLRCARRIEQGRVFVWIERGRLIFKADVVADTPDGIYLEGIYVNPQEQGQGYGLRCLSQLSRNLLARTKSICLLVNERNWKAQAFYLSAGYKLRGTYETIFLNQQNQ